MTKLISNLVKDNQFLVSKKILDFSASEFFRILENIWTNFDKTIAIRRI